MAGCVVGWNRSGTVPAPGKPGKRQGSRPVLEHAKPSQNRGWSCACSTPPVPVPLPLPQVAGLDTSSALGAFERMEEKVMSLEAQAEAAQMVSRRTSLAVSCLPACMHMHGLPPGWWRLESAAAAALGMPDVLGAGCWQAAARAGPRPAQRRQQPGVCHAACSSTGGR